MKRCHGQIHTARGNPYTEETKKIWRERFGTKLVGGNGYGLTEACVITSLAAGEHAAPGSSGKRIADFDVRIVDDNDHELPTNTLAKSWSGHCARTSCSRATGTVPPTP